MFMFVLVLIASVAAGVLLGAARMGVAGGFVAQNKGLLVHRLRAAKIRRDARRFDGVRSMARWAWSVPSFKRVASTTATTVVSSVKTGASIVAIFGLSLLLAGGLSPIELAGFTGLFTSEKVVRAAFDTDKTKRYALKLSNTLRDFRWKQLISKVTGFRVGMTRKDTEARALRNAAKAYCNTHEGDPAVLGALLVRFHFLQRIGTDEEVAWGMAIDTAAAEADVGDDLYAWLHTLRPAQAKRVAALGRWSSTVTRRLRAYALGIDPELRITTADLVKQALWPMRQQAKFYLTPKFGDEVKNRRSIDHVGTEYARQRLPGVVRVHWTDERRRNVYDDNGRKVAVEYAHAPALVRLPGGKQGVLVADSLEVSYYATAEMPEWLRNAISGAVSSCIAKVKSDLMTLLKRPGAVVNVEHLSDHTTLYPERKVDGVDVHDLGVWVLPRKAYDALASQVDAVGVGGLQGTVVFQEGAFFKGVLVPADLAEMPVGLYDGVKALGDGGLPSTLTPVWGSLMSSFVDVPWGCTVNAQAFTYADVEDGPSTGLTAPVVSFMEEQAEAFTLALANVAGFSSGFANWARAQAAEFGRKRIADGIGGQFVPTNRPDLVGRDGLDDVHFVVYTNDKSRDGDERMAGFFWSPALPTHTQVPRVNVRFEYRDDVDGNLIAVNVADDTFIANVFIAHAGRDIDGDGGSLVFEGNIVRQCTPVGDVELTDSVRWKATEDEVELESSERAIRASFERQFYSRELGTWELKSRRALKLGINLDREWQGTTLRERFAGQIQMAISAQKKRISRELWDRNEKAIKHALGAYADSDADTEWGRLTAAAGKRQEGSEFYSEYPTTMVDLPKAVERAMKRFRSAEDTLRRRLRAVHLANDSQAYLKAASEDIEAAVESLLDWHFELDALLDKVEAEESSVHDAQKQFLDMVKEARDLDLVQLAKDAADRAGVAQYAYRCYRISQEGRRAENLRAAGWELLHDYSAETRKYVAGRLVQIREIWRGDSVEDADFQERKLLVQRLFDDLVSVAGIGPVAAVAFAGNDEACNGNIAPGRLSTTLISVVFGVHHLVEVEKLTGIELVPEFLVPVRGAKAVPSVGDKLSYGQVMAQLPEGSLGALLDTESSYEVLGVREIHAKATTRKGVETAINAVLRLQRL